MVRFMTTTHPTDSPEERAARGEHLVVFEDGDEGTAFRNRAPYLEWGEDNGALTLPYADLADLLLRVALPPDADDWRRSAFYAKQPTAPHRSTVSGIS